MKHCSDVMYQSRSVLATVCESVLESHLNNLIINFVLDIFEPSHAAFTTPQSHGY